ncbi:hypothetical protein GN244_ATG09873 [Phytophthora infestans]|uniref:Uncharacterized protein n=1 Tax=Phytophthora infestans TaxID=4787 RepID=A0A833STT0_PHYIN|nr:hypothetical protein GN244_ATG09873 [Phytophthora infestans]KAF4145305.1 hypothetical protein GN958_ATG05494 [Phytophthora infestans]
MSESKQEFLRSRPTVDVTAVDISPNPAALTDELNLEVDFHLDAPVINGFWDIEVVRFCVSIWWTLSPSGTLSISFSHFPQPYSRVMTKYLYLDVSLTKSEFFACCSAQLGQVEATNYAPGDNHFQFSTPQINISGIQPSQLTNCGLLIAAFKDDSGDILDLKMVIQVSEQRGKLQRIIYSPLE